MSSRTRVISKKVKEEYSKMYMNNMYELFNLSLFQLLKLRHIYRSHMKVRAKEQKKLIKTYKRRGIRI